MGNILTTDSLFYLYILLFINYPNGELKSGDSEAVNGAQSRREVIIEAALHVDNVHLQGEGGPVVSVLRPLGVSLAPVEMELEDLVILRQGATTENTLPCAGHVDIKLLTRVVLLVYFKRCFMT